MARGTLTLLILAALAATIFVGCGAGSGDPSRESAERRAPKTASSLETEPQGHEGSDPSGKAAAKQPGHPTLGSADAPVVLTEYGDFQ